LKIKNLYVVRHGETDWNKTQRFQGRTDIKLNDIGKEQAVALKPIMQQLHIESAYSSTLARAYESAEIATQDLKISIQKDERLCETCIGDAEGLTFDEIIQKFGEESFLKWRSYEERTLDFYFNNGESKRQMMYRVRQAFLDIAQSSNRGSIAIFSHGMVMRAMTFIFATGVSADMQAFANGSIHHYVWSEDEPERLIYKGKIN
jgi:broad specificity phosphatase PhoE